MDELIKVALSQGLGYGLFVCLLFYVLKTTGDRELRYQNLLDTLAEKFNVVEDIKEDVKEIKNKIEGWCCGMLTRIINKVTSARWLIAVIMTIVFAVLAFTNRLSTDFITIYTMVIAFYFSKDREEKQ